jgi:tetratricopeptide (TPR) repeat protein
MKIFTLALLWFGTALPCAADFSELVKSGDVHDVANESAEALKYFLPAEKLEPNNVDLLVKLARQYALRMRDLPKKEDKIASVRTALAYSERAVALAPDQCDPHLSVAICLGKLTPFLSSKEQIEASKKIKSAAEKAVKFDPKNDYAWHILGRWHQALANIGTTTRILASLIYGDLPEASYEEAVRCFKKAISLKPSRLLHTVELGRTYAMMGKKAEAKRYLEQGLSMPNLEKDDPETKQRGRASLKDIS